MGEMNLAFEMLLLPPCPLGNNMRFDPTPGRLDKKVPDYKANQPGQQLHGQGTV
jgi:hypothetical protein